MLTRHRAVFFSAVVLMASWAWANLPRLADGQNGVLAFFLGSLFATALIFRSKPEGEGIKLPGWALGVLGAGGMVFSLVGLIIPVHQFEWLGILMVLYAALAWALPRRYGKDLIFALCLVYWIHPLPSQLFGPLQMGIQWISVKLSEGVLQIFNVRVWGDGFVLRTGGRVFGVPEACSGMKTAITVMFCGVGVGLLMRLKFWRMIALLVLGMIQVVALNVIRIAGIVWIGMDKPPDWNEKILHDTMGIFLLLAVALIHLDAILIRQWLHARERIRNLAEVNDLVGEDDEKILRWPTIWRIIFQWWKPVLLVLVTAILVLAAGYRLRPHHRMEMIRGVMQGLIATGDFENAQRAAQAALTMDPDDDELMVDLARIKMGQGKPEEGLRIIRRKPSQTRSLTERVLEARALLELKRIPEVSEVVAAFPVESRNLSGVSMVLAEFNAYLDKPSEVGPYVVKAARGVGTQEAIRNLFPYMASRDLWESIRLSDSELPYATPLQGVIAAEAWLRINNTSAAANVLRRAMKGRETNPIFLNSVIRVTREWAIPEWVGRFEALFLSNVKQLRPVELTLAMDGAFAIGRPDLGWIAYRCLETLAPDDPMLLIAPAEYGRKWFLFQHDVIGIAGSSKDLVDIKPFLQFAGRTSPWKELWADIPLADELGGIITREGYQRRLKLCLEALVKMESGKKLDLRLQLLWGRVLGELGRWDEAHAKLMEFETKAPRQHRDFLLAHSELYKAQSNWEANFEILSEFVRVESHPPLVVWLDLANAAMALDLGAYAMGCMEEARRDYPESEEWSLAMSGMWSFFGFWEEALFVVNQMKNPAHAVIRSKLLMETGRVMEGQKLVLIENLGDVPVPKKQTELLPPAEGVLDWRGGRIQEADYERERKAIKPHQAPFLKALNRVKAAWYDSRGAGTTSDLSTWDAVGRDARGKAVALNELGLLLLRQGRTNEADQVISKALDAMPGWSLLWRLKLITSGSESKRAVLAGAAVKACPLDSELWLGYVVAMGRSGAGAEWASREAEKAVEEKTHSPGVLVRAGDFWLRQGFTNAACVAARAAMKSGRGLLPATVLGVMAAVKIKDYPWALACARAGTEQALEPWPFYKIIIGIKGQSGLVDPDVIRALEGLASRYPQEGIWAAQLGEVYFRKGQTDRALGVLEDALAREEGKKQALPRTYLLAAEAARREGNLSRAAKILKSCRTKYPDDVNVLNNLIFTLAQDPLYVGEAAALLPELIKAKRDDFAIYDTAALVFMRMGDLQQAEVYMKKALTMVKKGEYAWLEVYLNAAEAQIRLGKYKDARESLALIMKSPERSAAMDVRARELQDEMTRREREQTGWF